MGAQPRIFCRGRAATGPDRPETTGTPLVGAEASGGWIRVLEESEAFGSSPPLAWMWLEYPLLWVEDRPDVSDLGRVLMQEGKGEGEAHWRYQRTLAGEWACVAHIQVHQPVLAAFDIPFTMPGMQRLLEGVVRTRELFLCVSTSGSFDPEDEGMERALVEMISSPKVIAIEFDARARFELVDCLVWWARLKVQ